MNFAFARFMTLRLIYKSLVICFKTYQPTNPRQTTYCDRGYNRIPKVVRRSDLHSPEVIPQHTQEDQVTEPPGIRLPLSLSANGALASALPHQPLCQLTRRKAALTRGLTDLIDSLFSTLNNLDISL
jgi:hypothetical protein